MRSETPTAWTADAIEEAFYTPKAIFQRAALRAAMDDRSLGTEVAMRVLRAALLDPYFDENFAPLYATSLVGYHRFEEAHSVLIAIARNSDDIADELWGDYTTECLHAVLWSTSGGQTDALWTLIEDPRAPPYCRVAAHEALWIGISEGKLDGDAIAARSAESFRYSLENDELTDGDAALIDLRGIDIAVRLSSFIPALEQGVERGLLFGYRDVGELHEAIEYERADPRLRAGGHNYPVDPMQLETWEYFRDSERIRIRDEKRERRTKQAQVERTRSEAKKNTQRRSKRKMQKRSRKRTRR
ncbi:MAG: DUF1186 domain-containing protein [Myxococcota bacterium]